jgi:hypothetical protein
MYVKKIKLLAGSPNGKAAYKSLQQGDNVGLGWQLHQLTTFKLVKIYCYLSSVLRYILVGTVPLLKKKSRDAPDIRPDNPALFYIRNPAGYRI